MGSFGFSPAGLRVLVVDADNEGLKSLQRMLTNCNYKVTACNLAKEATYMLGNKNEIFSFDIVMSDVNLGDVDGFEFLKYVSLNLEIPVIMMSGDGETSKVMKGVECGACDYLAKPIRRKDLRYIWLHVFRKRMQQQQYLFEDSLTTKEVCEDGLIAGKKRKDLATESGDRECGRGSAKKPRLVWTAELDNKFLKTVGQIGIDKATPKLIHNLMEEPSLTRENISSHLQKFKLKMSRIATQVSTTWITDKEQNLNFNACPSLLEQLHPDPNASTIVPSHACDASGHLDCPVFRNDLPNLSEKFSPDPNESAAVPSDAYDFLDPLFFDLPSAEEWVWSANLIDDLL